MTDRWGAVEADFARFYQKDLRREIHAPARRLWALVRNLPQESATWRVDGWTQQEELLATLIEVVDAGLLRLAQLQTAGKARVPKEPVQILRPGEQYRQPPNVVSIAEFARMTKGGE